MKPKVASSILTALLYTQGLLGFAGLSTVLLKDFVNAKPSVQSQQVYVVGSATQIALPLTR